MLLISPFISILLFIFLHCKVFLHSLFFSMLDNPTINVPLWSIHLLYITKFTESAKASNSVCFFCYLEFSPWFYVFVCSELRYYLCSIIANLIFIQIAPWLWKMLLKDHPKWMMSQIELTFQLICKNDSIAWWKQNS